MSAPRPLRTYDELVGALPDSWFLKQLAARWVRDRPAYAYGGAVGLWQTYAEGEPDVTIVGDPVDALPLAAAYAPAGLSVPRAAAEQVRREHGYGERLDWAFRWTDVAPQEPDDDVGWLPAAAHDEVTTVLAAGFPDASLPVGHSYVRRWAGLRRDGRLVAVLADATSVAGLGFLASIAAHPDVRGTGAGKAVTTWATAALVAEEGACGLWHMAANAVATGIYDALGYRDEDRMAYFPPAP